MQAACMPYVQFHVKKLSDKQATVFSLYEILIWKNLTEIINLQCMAQQKAKFNFFKES